MPARMPALPVPVHGDANVELASDGQTRRSGSICLAGWGERPRACAAGAASSPRRLEPARQQPRSTKRTTTAKTS